MEFSYKPFFVFLAALFLESQLLAMVGEKPSLATGFPAMGELLGVSGDRSALGGAGCVTMAEAMPIQDQKKRLTAPDRLRCHAAFLQEKQASIHKKYAFCQEEVVATQTEFQRMSMELYAREQQYSGCLRDLDKLRREKDGIAAQMRDFSAQILELNERRGHRVLRQISAIERKMTGAADRIKEIDAQYAIVANSLVPLSKAIDVLRARCAEAESRLRSLRDSVKSMGDVMVSEMSAALERFSCVEKIASNAHCVLSKEDLMVRWSIDSIMRELRSIGKFLGNCKKIARVRGLILHSLQAICPFEAAEYHQVAAIELQEVAATMPDDKVKSRLALIAYQLVHYAIDSWEEPYPTI